MVHQFVKSVDGENLQEEKAYNENIKMEIISKCDNKSIHSANENESDDSDNSDNVEITIPIDIDYDKCDSENNKY